MFDRIKQNGEQVNEGLNKKGKCDQTSNTNNLKCFSDINMLESTCSSDEAR